MFAMMFGVVELLILLLVLGSGGVLLLLIVLAAVACRRPGAAACRGRGSRWWLLLVPLCVALYFFSSIRVEKVSPTNAHGAAQKMASVQQAVVKQHEEIARRSAEMSARIERQMAKMDIHTLMDKADAPRIALPPLPPPAPVSPAKRERPDEVSTSENVEQPTEPAEEAEPATHAEPATEAEEAPPSEEASASEEAAEETESREAASVPAGKSEAEDGTAESVAVDSANGTPAAGNIEKAVPIARPAWVDASPKRVGNTWRDVIATEEFATKEECDREADRLLLRATFDHLQMLSGISEGGGPPRRVPATGVNESGLVILDERLSTAAYLARMGITIDYIRREIAQDEYLETVERSFGPMKKLYTLIEFTPAVDRELRARWDASQRQERITVVGVGAASVLGLLGMAWGLLKIDTLTRGYYTKRLFLGVPAAIIGGFLLLILLV